MKKQERETRRQVRQEQRQLNATQEASIADFVEQCRKCLTKDDFTRWHDEACASAGESFHVFEHLLHALSHTRVPITPPLRKAIDAVLACYQLDRSRLEILATLQYTPFWKSEYGYD